MSRRITRKKVNEKEVEEIALNLHIIRDESNKVEQFDTL